MVNNFICSSVSLPPGGYLIRCGQVETKIGISERRFQNTARSEVVTSLRAFLEVDIKNIMVSFGSIYHCCINHFNVLERTKNPSSSST